MAQVTRAQLPDLQKIIVGLGAVKSITFAGADPGEMDRYQVTFEKGTTEWSITVGKDGKLNAAQFNPAP